MSLLLILPIYQFFLLENNFYSWFCNFKANPNLDSFVLNPTIEWQNKLKRYLPCLHFNCVRKVKREIYAKKLSVTRPLTCQSHVTVNKWSPGSPTSLTHNPEDWSPGSPDTYLIPLFHIYSWATISSKACTGMCWEIDQSCVQFLSLVLEPCINHL